jgi:hypothetical protein
MATIDFEMSIATQMQQNNIGNTPLTGGNSRAENVVPVVLQAVERKSCDPYYNCELIAEKCGKASESGKETADLTRVFRRGRAARRVSPRMSNNAGFESNTA